MQLTSQEYIAACREAHGDAYDYSETVYAGSGVKMRIGCRVCGQFYYQRPRDHLSGRRGCPLCRRISSSSPTRRDTKIWHKPCSVYLLQLEFFYPVLKYGISTDVPRRRREIQQQSKVRVRTLRSVPTNYYTAATTERWVAGKYPHEGPPARFTGWTECVSVHYRRELLRHYDKIPPLHPTY